MSMMMGLMSMMMGLMSMMMRLMSMMMGLTGLVGNVEWQPKEERVCHKLGEEEGQ